VYRSIPHPKEPRLTDEKIVEMPPGVTAVDMTDSKPKAKRDGSVQRETYQKVQAHVGNGLSKKAAIALVAAEQEKTIGAVQGAYYAARSKELAPRSRPPARPGPRKGSRRRPAPQAVQAEQPELTALIGRIAENLNQLAAAVQAERRQSAELRSRLRQLRSALG
jgi:hypothetical protein